MSRAWPLPHPSPPSCYSNAPTSVITVPTAVYSPEAACFGTALEARVVQQHLVLPCRVSDGFSLHAYVLPHIPFCLFPSSSYYLCSFVFFCVTYPALLFRRAVHIKFLSPFPRAPGSPHPKLVPPSRICYRFPLLCSRD